MSSRGFRGPSGNPPTLEAIEERIRSLELLLLTTEGPGYDSIESDYLTALYELKKAKTELAIFHEHRNYASEFLGCHQKLKKYEEALKWIIEAYNPLDLATWIATEALKCQSSTK